MSQKTIFIIAGIMIFVTIAAVAINQFRPQNVPTLPISTQLASGSLSSNATISSVVTKTTPKPILTNLPASLEIQTQESSSTMTSKVPGQKSDFVITPAQPIVQTRQQIIDSNLKTIFANGDKLIVTDTPLVDAISTSPIPPNQLKYPSNSKTRFYILNSRGLTNLEKGIVGVYEIRSGNKNYRLIQTKDDVEYSKLFASDENFQTVTRIFPDIAEYDIKTLTKRQDNIFAIDAKKADGSTKLFEFDIFSIIDNLFNPPGFVETTQPSN
jgi:hypothetical protein